MKRLVYLYELDSVRNSKKEIILGQQALFEEIVKKGNTVVLSYNQLTDSEAFLYAVKNPDTYAKILKLFSLGVLKVSQYGKITTPSKYIQNAIEKCNAPDKNAFLFSGLPVRCTEKELLSKIQEALQYSDVETLQTLYDNLSDPDKKERLEYIKRFVEMILTMSLNSSSGNPAKTKNSPQKSFTDFLSLIYFVIEQNNITRQYPAMPAALKILKDIQANIENTPNGNILIQNRTNWISHLNLLKESEASCLAEAIIDLCYNYTVEDSISNISKRYDAPCNDNMTSFQNDFLKRLENYWALYQENNHIFHTGDSTTIEVHKIPLPPWDTAVRIIDEDQKLEKYKKNKSNSSLQTLYEADCAREKKLWNKRLAHQMLSRLQTAFIYIFVFCGVNYIMGLIQENLLGLFNSLILNEIIRICGTTVFATIIFGIIGSLISKWFHLPDILESVQSIGIGIKDLYRIITFPKRNSSKHTRKV